MIDPNSVNTAPHIMRALNPALFDLKEKGPNDNVASLLDVSAPQITPVGSPVRDQVAVAKGAPVPTSLKFVFDTSDFDDDVEDILGVIGKTNGIYECIACNTSANEVEPQLIHQGCDIYEDFLGDLCATPFQFALLDIKVRRTAGADQTTPLLLPELMSYRRLNLKAQGPVGTLDIANTENYDSYPRTDLVHTQIQLIDEAKRFDRRTRFEFGGLMGNRRYEITAYVATRAAQ